MGFYEDFIDYLGGSGGAARAMGEDDGRVSNSDVDSFLKTGSGQQELARFTSQMSRSELEGWLDTPLGRLYEDQIESAQEFNQDKFDLEKQLGLGRLGIDRQQLENALKLGLGGLDVQKGGLEVSQGRLDLDTLLGTGQLGRARERLGLDQTNSDRDFQLRLDNLKQQAERIAIEQGRAEADEWYQQQQIALAKDKLKQDAAFQADDVRLKEAELGYRVMEQGVKLSQTPADWFALSEWSNGVAQMPGTATFLNRLANSQQSPAFSATAGHNVPTAPASQTMQGLGNLMGYASQASQMSGGLVGGNQQQAGTAGGTATTQTTGGQGAAAGYSGPTPNAGMDADSWDAWMAANRSKLKAAGLTLPPGDAEFNWKARDYRAWWEQNKPAAPTQPTQPTTPGAGDALTNRMIRDASNKAAIRDIMARGAHTLGPGTLETMRKDDRDLLLGGIQANGGSGLRFLEDYQASRVNQGSALAA